MIFWSVCDFVLIAAVCTSLDALATHLQWCVLQ